MKRHTEATLDPSGVGANDYQLSVGTSEETVYFPYFWPVAMTCMSILHPVCIHPLSVGLYVLLKYFRHRITKNVSSALQFAIQSL